MLTELLLYQPTYSYRCDLEAQQAVKILLKAIKPDVNQTSDKLANPPLILAIEKVTFHRLKLLQMT